MVHDVLKLRYNGNTIRVMVHFDADNNIAAYQRCENAITQLQQKMRLSNGACAKDFGAAVLALYRLIFGAEGVNNIVCLYGDDVLSMVQGVNPYITTKIRPAIANASQRHMQQLRAQYLNDRKAAIHESNRRKG